MKEGTSGEIVCPCNKIFHELSQSLLVIHAYVSGCTERLKENSLSNLQLIEILKKINLHTEIIAEKIHCVYD